MLEGAATVTASARKITKVNRWSPRKRVQWTKVSQIGWLAETEYLELVRMYLGIATDNNQTSVTFCHWDPLFRSGYLLGGDGRDEVRCPVLLTVADTPKRVNKIGVLSRDDINDSERQRLKVT